MFSKRIFKFSVLTFFTIFFVFSFQYEINGQKKTSTVKHPEWSYDKVIYEVNIRQFTPEGTFKAFEKHLPELKDLGAGILWFMPINPIGEKNRKGTLGSYYSVKDYMAVNPDFGTMEDFKSLVEKIHELGMYVIIDWVANHTSWDNNLTIVHPDWFTKDSLGNFVLPVPDWSDVIDLNYDNADLRNYMTDALKFWVEKCNIDGYRCDVAGMMPVDFWNEARAELYKIKPVFMLAEWESPEMHEKAFDMTYSWDLYNIFNSIAKGEKSSKDIPVYLEKEKEEYPDNSFRMRFTSNHDENSWKGTVFERLGPAAETFAVLTCIIPGMPLIYNGQEAGLSKRLKFFEKDPIEWKEHKFRNIYSRLFHLKMMNGALLNGERGGEMIFIPADPENKAISFIREKGDDKIIGIFNLTAGQVSFKLKEKMLAGSYKNLFTDEEVNLDQKENITLKPWEYKVYSAE
ncbi:MAG: alpha-amylase family glycosyl hydrolase [Ignavibacteria bacterium]